MGAGNIGLDVLIFSCLDWFLSLYLVRIKQVY